MIPNFYHHKDGLQMFPYPDNPADPPLTLEELARRVAVIEERLGGMPIDPMDDKSFNAKYTAEFNRLEVARLKKENELLLAEMLRLTTENADRSSLAAENESLVQQAQGLFEAYKKLSEENELLSADRSRWRDKSAALEQENANLIRNGGVVSGSVYVTVPDLADLEKSG